MQTKVEIVNFIKHVCNKDDIDFIIKDLQKYQERNVECNICCENYSSMDDFKILNCCKQHMCKNCIIKSVGLSCPFCQNDIVENR